MRRGLVITASGIGVIAAMLFALVFWVGRTESGTAWLIDSIVARSGERMSVGAIEGAFASRLALADVYVRMGSDEVSIERLELETELSSLLAGTVSFSDVLATEVAYRKGDAIVVAESEGSTPPVEIEIQNGNVNRVLILNADNEYEIGPVTFSLHYGDDVISLSRFAARGFDVEVEGSGGLELETGRIEALEFEWSGEFEDQNFTGVGRVQGPVSGLDVELTMSSPMSVAVQGQLELGSAPLADVRVSWSELSWPDQPETSSPSGFIDLEGWIDDFSYVGSGNIVFQDETAEVSIDGVGTPENLTLNRLSITAEAGRLASTGVIQIDPLQWELALDGQELNPGHWFDEWQGSLSVDGNLKGRLQPALEWRMTNVNVDGVLRGRAVVATGSVGRNSNGAWQLESVELSSDRGVAQIDGEIADLLDFDLRVSAPDIAAFLPEASGALSIDGTVSGERSIPALSGSISGEALNFREYSADSVNITGTASLALSRPMSVEVSAEGLRWRNYTARSLTGEIEGVADRHSIGLTTDTEFGMLEFGADGGWQDDQWEGVLRVLEFAPPQTGTWSLVESASVGFDRQRFDFDSVCLRLDATRACGAASIGTDTPSIDVDIEQLNLALLQPWLPEEVALSGIYDGTLELVGPWSDARGVASIAGGATNIIVRESADSALDIPIRSLEADATIEGTDLTITGLVLGQDSAEIEFAADISDWPSDAPALDASVSGLWPDVSALSLLSPDVGDVSGRALLDVLVSGTVPEPMVQGEVQWLDGMLTVPQWGFSLDNIAVTASSVDGESAVIEGSATAGEGDLRLSGNVDLDPANGWPGSLQITGENLQAVRLPDAEVFVSPNLDIDLALPEIGVNGTLAIPSARLQLDEVSAQATLPSTDTVVHGVVEPAPTRPLRVAAEITISLGEDVRYGGAGLDTALGGSLALSYQSGQRASATGNINLEGQYQAYGQTLVLERSRLFFGGPLDNPDLDVRAVRRIDPTIVGVQLTGPLRSPTTRVFSEPAMAEADALSYLILGRPLADTDASDTAALESAAVSMGLRQALPVVQRVGETLGFDEFTVQTSAANTGELMAGKQLTPRLYMRYTYGLFNRLGGLLMRLQLNDRFSLETRSGEYKSMDLIYSSEASE